MLTSITSNNRFKKDLRTLDPNSQEYWDEILRREGLSMSRGNDRRLCHVGDTRDLEKIQEAKVVDQLSGGGRRVHPKGHGPQ